MKAFILSTALALAASSASAGDHYVAVFGGGAFTDDVDTSLRQGNITLLGETDFDDAVEGRIALGKYAFGLRFEGELSYRQHDLGRLTLTRANVGGNNVNFAATGTFRDTDQAALSGMFNVWYDFALSSRWIPYVGGGLGLSEVELDVGAVDSGAGAQTDSDTVFTYQIGAGIVYAMDEHASLGFGYRYLRGSDPEVSIAGTAIETELESHSALFEFRYRF